MYPLEVASLDPELQTSNTAYGVLVGALFGAQVSCLSHVVGAGNGFCVPALALSSQIKKSQLSLQIQQSPHRARSPSMLT